MRSTPPTRSERRAVLVFIAVVVALGYRPAAPWAGIAAGVVAFIELVLFLMLRRTVAQVRESKRPDRG